MIGKGESLKNKQYQIAVLFEKVVNLDLIT